MKKKRLKPIFKYILWILLFLIISILILLAYSKQVNYWNTNIEKCGSNYCDK